MACGDALLFTPMTIGDITVKHRVVLAPRGRLRNDPTTYSPFPELASTYYTQRASTQGTLLISEATFVSPEATGVRGVSGIWSDDQVATWRQVSIDEEYKVTPTDSFPR